MSEQKQYTDDQLIDGAALVAGTQHFPWLELPDFEAVIACSRFATSSASVMSASVLSPAAKNEREQVFRRRMAEYQQKAAELNREVQEKQKDVLEAFRDKVEAVVAKVAKRNGLQVVIDKGKGGPAIFGAEELDLTNQVIEEFNREYP